jgi:uncharacterized protein YdeI (YjbR/CyaY-like superfamily)
MLNALVDEYLAEGCGRCKLAGTPQCKVHNWTAELRLLRNLVLECGLVEERKWGVPTYTHQGKNILIVAAFKEYCCMSFFKGSLLQNTYGLLVAQGQNAPAGRMIKCTHPEDILKNASHIKAHIFEAIELENAGRKVNSKPVTVSDVPQELLEAFAKEPELKIAFEHLTQGKKRGYLIHFNGAKQSSTRHTRIQKCIPLILQGKGINEDYKKRNS